MSEFVISNTNLSKLFGAITDKTHKLEIVIVNGTGERSKFIQGSKLRIIGEIYISVKKNVSINILHYSKHHIINYFTENGHIYLEIQNFNYIEILNEEKLSMAELILGGEILKRE